MMDKLTADHKEFFLETKAKDYTLPECLNILYEAYPTAPEYTARTFQRWVTQPEIKEQYKEIEARLRKKVRGYSYANKDSRLMALIEISQRMMSRIRAIKVSDKSFTGLNRELRENFKFIREEVDPFGIEDPEIKSSFQSFRDSLKGTEWEQVFQERLAPLNPQTS